MLLESLKTNPEQSQELEEELNSRGGCPEFPLTLLPEFSRKIWGLKKGLTVIGGRSSQGKSALVAQIAFDLALQEKTVLFLSLEMTEITILERLFCMEHRINNFDLQRGMYQKDEEIRRKWGEFKVLYNSLPLKLTCNIGKTFREVIEIDEYIKPDVVIVDYIQSVRTKANENREMLNEYIRQFRQYALERGFVGILCSQINRTAASGENEPAMYQLKETGSLEELADTVILIFWKYHYDKSVDINECKLILAKQRNGRTGSHKIFFEPEYYRFSEKPKEIREVVYNA